MKKALLLLALVQGITFSAYAQTTAPVDGGKTRTEVKAETKAAIKAGELNTGGNMGVTKPAADAVSTKTRAEVKANTKVAAEAGKLNPSNVTVPAPMLKTTSTADGKTRAEVKAETRAAMKADGLNNGNIGKQLAPVVRKAPAEKIAKPAADQPAK